MYCKGPFVNTTEQRSVVHISCVIIIGSEWVLCWTKLNIWLFAVLSLFMQIINHSDRKSIVFSSLIFETWLNDVRFVLVQRLASRQTAKCEVNVCPVTAETLLSPDSSESLRLVLKQTQLPVIDNKFQFKWFQQDNSECWSDHHENTLLYPNAIRYLVLQ